MFRFFFSSKFLTTRVITQVFLSNSLVRLASKYCFYWHQLFWNTLKWLNINLKKSLSYMKFVTTLVDDFFCVTTHVYHHSALLSVYVPTLAETRLCSRDGIRYRKMGRCVSFRDFWNRAREGHAICIAWDVRVPSRLQDETKSACSASCLHRF